MNNTLHEKRSDVKHPLTEMVYKSKAYCAWEFVKHHVTSYSRILINVYRDVLFRFVLKPYIFLTVVSADLWQTIHLRTKL